MYPYARPSDVSSTTAGSVDATDHVSNIGPTADGDRLIAKFLNDGDATVTTPGGWTLLNSTANGTANRVSWYYRDTDGSDSGGTVNFITSAAEQGCAQIWRFLAGSFDPAVPPEIAVATGSGTAPDPPDLAPSWGAGVDTTYLAAYGKDDDDGTLTTTQWPPNCFNGVYLESNSGASTSGTSGAVGLAHSDAGSFNPDAFSGLGSQEWVSATVAIKGAGPHGKPYPTNLTSGVSAADAASYATASITPPADKPILAAVWSHVAAGNPNQPTASGNGITWTVVASVLFDVDRLTLFIGSAASPSVGALTFDFGGQTQLDCFWTVQAWAHLQTAPVVQSKTFSGSVGAGSSPAADFDAAFASPDNVTLSVVGRQGSAIPTITPDTGYTQTQVATGSNDGGVEVEYLVGEDQTPQPVLSHTQDTEQIIVELAAAVVEPPTGQAYLTARGQLVTNGTSGTAFVRLTPHRAGDILLIFIGHQEAAQAGGVDIDGFTLKTDHQNGANSFQLWWKRAASDAEADPVITHTFAAGANWYPLAVRGAAATGDPFDAVAAANHAVNSVYTFPDITTTADDELILHLLATQSNPTFSNWTNANISPKQVINRQWPGHTGVAAGFGHMGATGAIGGTTVQLNASVLGSVGSYAFRNGDAVAEQAGALRDSVLSDKPADGAAITLPTHAEDDSLVAIITGTDATLIFAATLSGFTKVLDVPAPFTGHPFSVHKRIAASGAEANPTIDHGLNAGSHNWTVLIFSIPGTLGTYLWDAGVNNSGINDIEVGAPSTVVGYANSTGAENWTSYTMAVATGETEHEDGGSARVALYTADMAAAGNIGIAQPVVQFGSGQNWAVLAFSEEGPPPTTGSLASTQAPQVAALTGTVTNPGGGGGGGASGTQAVRRARRRRSRR